MSYKRAIEGMICIPKSKFFGFRGISQREKYRSRLVLYPEIAKNAISGYRFEISNCIEKATQMIDGSSDPVYNERVIHIDHREASL